KRSRASPAVSAQESSLAATAAPPPAESSSNAPPAFPPRSAMPFHFFPPPTAQSPALQAPSPSPAPIRTNRTSRKPATTCSAMRALYLQSVQRAQTPHGPMKRSRPERATPLYHRSIHKANQVPHATRIPNDTPHLFPSQLYCFRIFLRKITYAK